MNFKSAKLLNNNQGMAILMVMTAVTLLTFILAELTYETKLNKLKVYNLQDKIQARLSAESGLKFALAKLRIYQEGRNLIEKDENVRSMLKPSTIEKVVTQPFVYPIPTSQSGSLIKKKLIDDFSKTILLRGELILSISPVSGFINPNNLRKVKKTNSEKDEDPSDRDRNRDEDRDRDQEEKKAPNLVVEQKLLELLNNAIEKRREKDELFATIYANIKPGLLIKELKFYVSDPEDFNDAERAEIEAMYLGSDITPKHAPLSSIDELYQLQGWDTEIVNLIKDQLTVHEATVIPLNKINEDQLKLLFPDITPNQTEEFFLHRNGDPEKNIEAEEFKSVEDFKKVIVDKIGVLNENSFNERVKEFEMAGLKLGVAGKLFKVVSTGKYNDFTYNMTAFVDLPIKPTPPKKKSKKTDKKDPESNDQKEDDLDQPPNEKEQDRDDKDKKKKVPEELLRPRVIEVRIE